MENILLSVCNCLSCFIIVSILFQFMNERYNRLLKNKYIYFLIELGIVIGIAAINLLNNATVNLIAWITVVALSAYFLYYEDSDKKLTRVLESEVLALCMVVCETLGVVLLDWVLNFAQINIDNFVMQTCLEVTFSKVILIFLYYMAVSRLMKKKQMPFNRMQYGISFIILLYSLVNIFVIAEGVAQGQVNYILVINMGCIVLADLYLLYFIKVANERNFFENEVQALEEQAKMQYEYYLRQEQKYNITIQILHDINKHTKTMGQLCAAGNIKAAMEYGEQIGGMLSPLIPVKYTGNPILDILLTDKTVMMREKKIKFEIKVDNVLLDFLEPIDITTIFGNLLDNAMEACEEVEQNKYISITISSYHEMLSVRIENSSNPVKWKNGTPVSKKGKRRGIGLVNVRRSIERYDGSMKLKNADGRFVVDLFLNF